jgi:hypothetical protein
LPGTFPIQRERLNSIILTVHNDNIRGRYRDTARKHKLARAATLRAKRAVVIASNAPYLHVMVARGRYVHLLLVGRHGDASRLPESAPRTKGSQKSAIDGRKGLDAVITSVRNENDSFVAYSDASRKRELPLVGAILPHGPYQRPVQGKHVKTVRVKIRDHQDPVRRQGQTVRVEQNPNANGTDKGVIYGLKNLHAFIVGIYDEDVRPVGLGTTKPRFKKKNEKNAENKRLFAQTKIYVHAERNKKKNVFKRK